MSVPIGEALAGVEIVPLDEGDIAVGVIVIVKVLNAEGEECLAIRSQDVKESEQIGFLTMALDLRRKSALDSFVEDDD